MAATNAVYPSVRERFLNAAINWGTAATGDVIKAALFRGYTYSAAHVFLSDVNSASTGGAAVATSSALDGKSLTLGVADANDTTWTSVTAGAACDSVIVFKDTGSAASSPVIACFQSATGLPVTPNGTSIPIVWDNGAFKIFAI